jgi:predicted RNA-binding protein
MAYFTNLFSPDTYEAFSKSNRDKTGFPRRQLNTAGKVKPGDKLLCYMTRLSRWIGVHKVLEGPFIDETPIFAPTDDRYIVRFRIEPLVWLPKEFAVPIQEDDVWKKLDLTRSHERGTSQWTGKFRSSLIRLSDEDGKFLESLLEAQVANGRRYEVDEDTYRKYLTKQVRGLDQVVSVSVPGPDEEKSAPEATPTRESIKAQALLARIGERMGFRVWIPKQDRASVLTEWSPATGNLLEALPLNYDDVTLNTIEQIDVLWLKGRAIARAFEVEHTTAVYSGILRMADLLALQPNMDIQLHIVAPADRKDKVLSEIKRPVFSLLDKGPLYKYCTFISYDSLRELSKVRHLNHLSDSVLAEYTEEAQS